jgi:chloride channel protein, CIC family
MVAPVFAGHQRTRRSRALELTHDLSALLPLLVACAVAHLLGALTLKRSILTEKIARRGYHVMREYEVDPLHALLVRDVMSTDVPTVHPDDSASAIYAQIPEGSPARRQRLYPVLDAGARLLGVLAAQRAGGAAPLRALAREPLVAYADETPREVADKMVASGHGVLPVTDRARSAELVGLVSQFDLLRAHERLLVGERHRERSLGPPRLADLAPLLVRPRQLRR